MTITVETFSRHPQPLGGAAGTLEEMTAFITAWLLERRGDLTEADLAQRGFTTREIATHRNDAMAAARKAASAVLAAAA